ncbi:hypothetical protein FRC06_001778 [Ceratobasidium sp. 370]|nr:hypothetical protein FRC06_001778 [Ceratobasidium sp. 370]
MHLTEHGCANLTRDLDSPSSSSTLPIAQGGFGLVYSEKLRDGRQVAIKALRISFNDNDEADKLPKVTRSTPFICENLIPCQRAARELYTWSRCRHPNILPLLGLAEFQNQIRMVSLWMDNGSLPSYLDKHPDLSRYDMSVHVCNGLEYLHRTGVVSVALVVDILDLTVRQIHGDLKGVCLIILKLVAI